MSALTPLLKELILTNGPMSLATYMQLSLLHPEHGYYATRDPLGSAGDFTTAPEISQMFGELLGAALAQSWMDQGGGPVTIVELGPGRGTLMRDVLRVVRTHIEHVNICLIEASAHLRDAQAQTLAEYDIQWCDSVEDIPDGPILLLANEFFDALPIRQFRKGTIGWFERRVGLIEGRLGLGETEEVRLEALSHRWEDTRENQIVELCPSGTEIVQSISRCIASFGGAAVIVDYGNWRSLGDTFQAVASHKPVDPFASPGNADLTAHVDFEALSQAAGGVNVSQMVSQGVLLERLGITDRARQLTKSLEGSALDEHIAAHRRLTHPDEMGQLFKAIALYPRDQASVPGFVS